MIIRSLGRRTDIMFTKFSGTVTDKGNYIVLKTPSTPDYHWGNFIVFNHAPQIGTYKEWTKLFDQEFSELSERNHYLFTWETDDNGAGEYQEFLDANFEFDTATVLTTKKLHPPPHLNNQLQIRRIKSDRDWKDVVELQILCADAKYANTNYRNFKERQMANYRRMSDAGLGSWFGAFKDDTLVGDMGIFFEGRIARYQSVETRPKFRQQGICGTLVYQAGLVAINEFGVDCLVMEADVDYHAARIYESVGFKRTETNHVLSWWRGKTNRS